MKRTAIMSAIIISFVLVALGLGFWYAVRHVLPYSAIRPYRVTQADIERRYNGESLDVLYPFERRHFHIPTRDSAVLDAWFVPATNAKGTIIVLHGIASCKEMVLPRIARYHAAGYNVVAYDSRANGQSTGLNCTLGFYEKFDVVDCITATEQQFHPSLPWGIHGGSMGGAVSLQAMAIEPRLHCGVVFCSFASLRETMLDYMEQMFTVRWTLVSDYIFRESERIASYRIDEVRPEESARTITQPLLLIHGENDEKINIRYGRRIFANLASSEKEMIVVPGAGHFDVDRVGGDAVDARIVAWMDSHIHHDK